MSENTNYISQNFDVQFYDKKLIQEVLSNEKSPEALKFAFWFDLEPPGYEYWDRERSRPVLSGHAAKKLVNML